MNNQRFDIVDNVIMCPYCRDIPLTLLTPLPERMSRLGSKKIVKAYICENCHMLYSFDSDVEDNNNP
jgi:DNA-directed RNA polymerase subunit RPC12/RpoP